MPLIASSVVLGAVSGSLLTPSSPTIYIAFIASVALFLLVVFQVLFTCTKTKIHPPPLMGGGKGEGDHVVLDHPLPCPPPSRGRGLLVVILLFVAAFIAGFALAGRELTKSTDVTVPLSRWAPIACDGIVERPLQLRPQGARADVRLLSCSTRRGSLADQVRGMARLTIDPRDADLLPGQRIRFKARFFTPREYHNPGGFLYRRYLAVHGIGVQGFVRGRVERMEGDLSFLARVELMRRKISASIAANINPPARDIVQALAIGDQGGIDREVRDIFANTGLAHLLAISGMNVGYVAAFIFMISYLIFGRFPWLLLRFPLRQLAAAVTIPAVWMYVLLTGMPVSAIRAAIMLTVFLLGAIMYRRQDLLTTLAVSVIVIIFFLPLSVFDVSFQLSVIAVAGIILISPRLIGTIGTGDRSTWSGRIRVWIVGLIAVSTAAGIATTPIVAYHFKFVAGVGLVANLIAVPLTGAFLSPVVAVASALTLFFPWVASPLWKVSGVAASLFIDFAQAMANLGESILVRWAPNIWDVVFVYAALVAIVFSRRLKYKGVVAVILVASLVIFNAGYARIMRMIDKDLSITFFDVGQGDSALVRFPNGQTMLVDGGGIKGASFDVGRHVVAPALWRMGIHKLDWIVLTHPHHDHYRGLAYIAKEFGPRLIWTNGQDSPPDERGDWEQFLVGVKDADVPLVVVEENWPVMDVGGVKFQIIKPPVAVDLNAGSLAIDLRYGSHHFLVTGDLAGDGALWLVGNNDDLSTDVLKIGHHGHIDAVPWEFLNALKPRIAVISVGSYNKYKLPHREAIERIESVGAAVLRTDLDGAITIKSDGRQLDVRTFVKR